jgi:hypothetical protein
MYIYVSSYLCISGKRPPDNENWPHNGSYLRGVASMKGKEQWLHCTGTYVWMLMCMFVCIYVYICIYMFIYVFMYMYIYTYIYIHIFKNIIMIYDFIGSNIWFLSVLWPLLVERCHLSRWKEAGFVTENHENNGITVKHYFTGILLFSWFSVIKPTYFLRGILVVDGDDDIFIYLLFRLVIPIYIYILFGWVCTLM